MKELLKQLCEIGGVSGREEIVRDFIIDKISPFAKIQIDALGNIIAFKKGRNNAKKTIMLDAHMDEVGLIITSVTDSGMLRFSSVGGVEPDVLISKSVVVNGLSGVIGSKPIHLCENEERKKMPSEENLYIDIGASDKSDAEKYVRPGDIAVFDSDFCELGNSILAKAIDDRAGCAILIDLLRQPAEYDFYATFTVQEEVGLRGAGTACCAVNPDFAIVIEATTAADLSNVPSDKQVCKVGGGAVISFMDHSTMYDRELFDTALETAKIDSIPAQVKHAVAGGNNAGRIHLTGNGVRTIAISVPCRYIHSPSSVADINDIYAVRDLAAAVMTSMANGEIE